MRGCRSHLRCVPVVLGGRPGTSACSSAGEPTTSRPGRPRMCAHKSSLDARDRHRAHLLVRRRAAAFARDLQRGLAPTRRDERGRRRPGSGHRSRPRSFLGAVDGVDAGSAAAGIAHGAPGPLSRRSITVLPQLRRRGVGVGASRRRRRRGRTSTACESSRRPSSPTTRRASASRCRRGFHEHSREIGLELELVGWSRRLSIRRRASRSSCSPIVPSSRRVPTTSASRRFPTSRDSEDWTPPPFEQFVAAHLRGLAIFLAVADGEVVGYAKLHEHPDGRTADHGMTAVKRAWRGRGIAQVAEARARSRGRKRTASSV